MLRDSDFKFHYTSEEDNIYEDFFVPALSDAVNYKRAVGYFSLGVILNTPQALSQLVDRKGKIQIVFAKLVSEVDLAHIQEGLSYNFTEDIPSFMELISKHAGTLIEYRVKLLAYLFTTGRLEIKIALRRNGIFHQKVGLLEDADGNIISFNGSMNETASALDPDKNSEEITVFKSWEIGQQEYVEKHLIDFNKLWKNESSENTIVCDLPDVLRDELDIISHNHAFTPSIEEENRLVKAFISYSENSNRLVPKIPERLNGRDFKIREHQTKALSNWKDNNFEGILELATGTGKTITSIYGLVKITEKIAGLSVIISVPYVDLAEQWVDELKLFNIHALKCFGNRASWEPQLNEYVRRNQVAQNEFIALVVVNKTFKSENFQQAISNLDPDKTMFIGDECHHHMSKSFVGRLPSKAKFKLGLSATPFHYLDEEANDRLKSFYRKVVYGYSLYEAIDNGILTQYEYHPIPVTLTFDETDLYYELSEKIGRLIAANSSSGSDQDEQLKSLLMRRSRLIGTATNKLKELDKLISQTEVPQHSLFYCSDGKVSDESEDYEENVEDELDLKQRIAVARLLRTHGITASFFTADETRSQRTNILADFKSGQVQSLVAIKCLDEGIDVPACSTAYILASSRNPRQFVQRRGRILRKSENKDKATIYDFVAVLPPGSIEDAEKESDFFKAELARVADFAKHSINPISSLKPLDFWLKKYDVYHLVV